MKRRIYKQYKINKRGGQHYIVNYGMGWNIEPLYSDEEVKERIEYMPPEKYLKMTTPLPPGWEKEYHDIETKKLEPIEKLSEHIKSKEKKVPIPWVESHFGKINPSGHEGRHRALAAKLAGEKEIPVHISDKQYRFEKDPKSPFGLKKVYIP